MLVQISTSSPTLRVKLAASEPPEVVEALMTAVQNVARLGDSQAQAYANAAELAFDEYGIEGVKSQVLYMLLGAGKWQGEEAKNAKKILKKWAVK